jgi:hypothetical protein
MTVTVACPHGAGYTKATIEEAEFYAANCEVVGGCGEVEDRPLWAKQLTAANLLAQAIGPLLANAALADGNGCQGRQESAWAEQFNEDPKGCLKRGRQAVDLAGGA